MRQYCRYCANAYIAGDYEAYCEQKKELRTERQCSRANKCKYFELNPEDVFDPERKYKPRNNRRIAKIKVDKRFYGKQINLFGGDEV